MLSYTKLSLKLWLVVGRNQHLSWCLITCSPTFCSLCGGLPYPADEATMNQSGCVPKMTLQTVSGKSSWRVTWLVLVLNSLWSFLGQGIDTFAYKNYINKLVSKLLRMCAKRSWLYYCWRSRRMCCWPLFNNLAFFLLYPFKIY